MALDKVWDTHIDIQTTYALNTSMRFFIMIYLCMCMLIYKHMYVHIYQCANVPRSVCHLSCWNIDCFSQMSITIFTIFAELFGCFGWTAGNLCLTHGECAVGRIWAINGCAILESHWTYTIYIYSHLKFN